MTIPDYTLRYSQKAKYLQLRISVRGLEVVVPGKRRVSPTMIEQFVQQKKLWIIRHWQRFTQAQEKREVLAVQLPANITGSRKVSPNRGRGEAATIISAISIA